MTHKDPLHEIIGCAYQFFSNLYRQLKDLTASGWFIRP